MNQNPEQIARDVIDDLLQQAGWVIQSKAKIDFSAGLGIAVREYQTDAGPADYVLFINRKPVGIIEAKREEEGVNLTMVEEQSVRYANAKLKYLNNEPLTYVYETTGTVTRFTIIAILNLEAVRCSRFINLKLSQNGFVTEEVFVTDCRIFPHWTKRACGRHRLRLSLIWRSLSKTIVLAL